MTDDNLGVESAGNPCESPARWPGVLAKASLIVACAWLLLIIFLPDSIRAKINWADDPTVGLTRAQLWELREVCSYLERR